MPTKPPRLCPRCGTIVRGRCPNCSPQPWSTSTRPGSTRASRKARAKMLAEQPVCAWPGCTQPATEDDHIIPWTRRGTMTREQWDHRDNHQGLCTKHHNEKTRMENNGGRGA